MWHKQRLLVFVATVACAAHAHAAGDEAALEFLRSQEAGRAIELEVPNLISEEPGARVVRAFWVLDEGISLSASRALQNEPSEIRDIVTIFDDEGRSISEEFLQKDAEIYQVLYSRSKQWPGVLVTVGHDMGVVFFELNGNRRFEYFGGLDEHLFVDADAELICSNVARKDAARFRRNRNGESAAEWSRIVDFYGRPVLGEIEALIDSTGGVVHFNGHHIVVREVRQDGGIVLKEIDLRERSLGWSWTNDKMVGVYPFSVLDGAAEFALLQAWAEPTYYLFDLKTGEFRGELSLLSFGRIDANGHIYGVASVPDKVLGHYQQYVARYDSTGVLVNFGAMPLKVPFLNTHVNADCMALQYLRPDDMTNWTAVYDMRSVAGDETAAPRAVVPLLVPGTWSPTATGGGDLVLRGFRQSGVFQAVVISRDMIKINGKEVWR